MEYNIPYGGLEAGAVVALRIERIHALLGGDHELLVRSERRKDAVGIQGILAERLNHMEIHLGVL